MDDDNVVDFGAFRDKRLQESLVEDTAFLHESDEHMFTLNTYTQPGDYPFAHHIQYTEACPNTPEGHRKIAEYLHDAAWAAEDEAVHLSDEEDPVQLAFTLRVYTDGRCVTKYPNELYENKDQLDWLSRMLKHASDDTRSDIVKANPSIEEATLASVAEEALEKGAPLANTFLTFDEASEMTPEQFARKIGAEKEQPHHSTVLQALRDRLKKREERDE